MYTIDDIKVKLLNPDEVKNFIKKHGEVACICYDTDKKYAERVGLSCMREGHMSGSRGSYFLFEIECPRFTADQIARHEVGVFKNMQSQRYVDMDDDFSIYVPPKVMNNDILVKQYKEYEEMCKAKYKVNRACFEDLGITGEQANDLMRTMLPIGVKTKLTIGFTLEALSHFMNKRLCTRADLPIRKVAELMKEEVLKVEPRYEELLMVQCEMLGYCPERYTCGKAPTKKEFKEILKKLRGEERMNVNKYKDYFEFNGYKYTLKDNTKQVEIDKLYYQIALDRNISYAEYLDIIDYISSPAYRKKTIEEIFNTFYIK